MKLWKTALCAVVVALLIVLVLPGTAEAKTSGYYTYTVSGGKATITEVSPDIYGNVVVPSSLGGYSVKTIGPGAFAECDEMISVTIPGTVTSIGKGAFYGCWGLEFAYLSEGVVTLGDYAFEDCEMLVGVELPASLKTIGEGAFSLCFSLEELYVPESSPYFCTDKDGVLYSKDMTRLVKCPVYLSGDYRIADGTKTIDSFAFDCYEDLTTVYIPAGVTTIQDLAFYDCMGLWAYNVDAKNPNYYSDDQGVLYNKAKTKLLRAPQVYLYAYFVPQGVTAIADYAFYKCGEVQSVVLPEGVTTIGLAAFEDCKALCHIGLPSTLKTISAYAFASCEDLPRVAIPSGVTSLPEAAFGWCNNLRYLELPVSVTKIDPYAFYSCESLFNIYYTGTKTQKNKIDTLDDPDDVFSSAAWHVNACPSDRHDYGDGFQNVCTVCGCPRSARRFLYTATVSEVTIDGYSEPLGGEVVIPAYIGGLPVTAIAPEAFMNQDGITSVVIGGNVKTIGGGAFYGCDALQKVTLGNSVTTIEESAFGYCSNLESVFLSKSVKTIRQLAFNGCYKLPGITVDSASSYFSTDSRGVLYDKEKTRLLFAPHTISGTYSLPATVKTIDPWAISECWGLEKVVLPEGLTTIGEYAFCFDEKLKEIRIPASVTEIQTGAFMSTDALEYVWVDPNNSAYSSDEAGVLYNKDQTALLFAPGKLSGHYRVPDGVEIITEMAMILCERITSLELPASLSKIESYAFGWCENLKDVWYGGSQEQKDRLRIDEGNDYLLDAIWHLNFCGEGNHSYSSLCAAQCGTCGFTRTPPHSFGGDLTCDLCGHVGRIPGDFDGNDVLSTDDAVYLLLHVMFGSTDYPVPNGMKTDIDGNGATETDDAVYLLLHVMFGAEDYPL